MTTNPLKRHSAEMTDGPSRAPARAMLKAIGFTDDDLGKPLIGVATTWIETMREGRATTTSASSRNT